MNILVIPFPTIDPVAVSFGPLPIRWYALGYIIGLLGGWGYALALVRNGKLWGNTPRPSPESIGDLMLYMTLGIIIGGRLGQVFLYAPGYYFSHPLEIVQLWRGGMAFHGGFLGALLAIWYFARRTNVSALTIADICATTCPIGIFLVRLANFSRPELWGRPTNVPWAMIFPSVDASPRHPSQLYEALLEGLLLLLILGIVACKGGLRRPGLLAGLFGVGYGSARIVAEFFREPDASERLGSGLTMGMVLSVPVFLIGVALLVHAYRAAHNRLGCQTRRLRLLTH